MMLTQLPLAITLAWGIPMLVLYVLLPLALAIARRRGRGKPHP